MSFKNFYHLKELKYLKGFLNIIHAQTCLFFCIRLHIHNMQAQKFIKIRPLLKKDISTPPGAVVLTSLF